VIRFVVTALAREEGLSFPVMRRSLMFLVVCCVFCPAVARAQNNPLSQCKQLYIEKEEVLSVAVPAGPAAGASAPAEGARATLEWKLSGNVKVTCDGMLLQADEIHWRDDSPMVFASGNVHFAQSGTRVDAQRLEMNRETKLGTFFQASGRMDLLSEKPDKSLFGTQEPYILFWAEEVEKVEDDKFMLRRGGFTSCTQPTPRWDMQASTLTLVPNEHAILKNMVLRVKDVPLFYLPALYYPITHTSRATGFLIPTYGQSTVRGLSLSNAFFWAINRSQDATIYHDYFSQAGQGFGGEYRYASSGGAGNGRMYMLNERARLGTDGETVVTPAQRSFDLRGDLNQSIGGGTRVTGRVNYFTSIQSQQLYQQSLYDLSLRTRSFSGAISGGKGRYRLGAQVDRSDVFYGTDASRYGTLPMGTFSISEKPIGKSPVYFGANMSGGYLIRQDDITDPKTNRSLFRFDGGPTFNVPVSTLPALTVNVSAAMRYTYWTDQLDPELGQVTKSISRRVIDLQARAVGPVFSRIWRTPNNGYAEGFKHLIEPSVTIGWMSTYKDSAKLVQLDGVDTLVTGTTTLNYGLANRILAKRRFGTAPDGTPTSVVREFLNVDIRQTYYTNSRAAQYDPQYQSSFGGLYNYYVPPSPFSPIQVSATSRPTDTASANFRLEYDTKYMAVRTYGASATVDQPAMEVTAGWSKRQVIPGLAGFDNPAGADHFLNINTTVRDPGNSVGGTYNFSYDMLRDYFLQRRFRFYYNSQCCGVALDYQTVDLTHFGYAFARNDRRIALSFTLAGIGTFSNPLGSFGGNSGSR
jgi:LPS-assembly protein